MLAVAPGWQSDRLIVGSKFALCDKDYWTVSIYVGTELALLLTNR